MRKMTASQMEDELAILMGRTAVDRKRIEYLERRVETLLHAINIAPYMNPYKTTHDV